MRLQEKTVAMSKTEQVQIVMPQHISSMGRLFGGRLMEWIDVVAAVVGRRHCGFYVTTASVGSLDFKAPAYADDTVVLQGQMTYAGTSSMEVRVETYVECLSGERKLINRAYLVLVALDERQQPAAVPRLIPQTPEELREWQAGEKRHALRKRQ